jgi:Uma2 family endonuclease
MMSPAFAAQNTSVLKSLATMGARRLTVAEYHKMHDAGIFMEGERVELLDGFVVEKPVRNPPHDVVLQRLTKRLLHLGLVGWEVRIQSAVTFAGSEPEPDAAVVRGDETTYEGRHPGPADFGVLCEVSSSTLGFDRKVKAELYALAGVPVYWVLNVADRAVEVYADPDPAADPPAYRTRADYPAGRDVPLVLDGATAAVLPVADLFPA